MIVLQREIVLAPRPRGFHVVTAEVLAALRDDLAGFRVGVAHLFLLHTSASLAINEHASPEVLDDFETYFNHTVTEDESYWTHTVEGPDDMPAHVKAALMGTAVSVPIRDGGLWLGTWQGIYLGEHRNRAAARHIAVTMVGEPRS